MRSLGWMARVSGEPHIYEKFLTWSRGWALPFLLRVVMAPVV